MNKGDLIEIALKKDVTDEVNYLENQVNIKINEHLAETATEENLGHIRLSDIPPAKGIRVLASDPANPQEGEMWINSSEHVMKIYLNGKVQVTNIVSEVYLLESGYEHVDWVQGYMRGDGSVHKNAGHILVRTPADGSSISEATIVTDNAIDFGLVKKVLVDWETISDAPSSYRARLNVSSDKLGGSTIYDAQIAHNTFNTRRIDELEVGGMSGDYYIRIHSYSGPYGMDVKVYSVWLVY